MDSTQYALSNFIPFSNENGDDKLLTLQPQPWGSEDSFTHIQLLTVNVTEDFLTEGAYEVTRIVGHTSRRV